MRMVQHQQWKKYNSRDRGFKRQHLFTRQSVVHSCCLCAHVIMFCVVTLSRFDIPAWSDALIKHMAGGQPTLWFLSHTFAPVSNWPFPPAESRDLLTQYGPLIYPDAFVVIRHVRLLGNWRKMFHCHSWTRPMKKLQYLHRCFYGPHWCTWH